MTDRTATDAAAPAQKLLPQRKSPEDSPHGANERQKPRPRIQWDASEFFDDDRPTIVKSMNSAPAQKNAVLRKKLKRLLCQKEKLATAIADASWSLSSPEDAQSLGLTEAARQQGRRICDRMKRNLVQLQSGGLTSLKESTSTLDRARYDLDPVLVYTIASELGMSRIRKRIEQDALRAYATYTDEYECILGSLISASIRDRTCLCVAKRKFYEGTNATARDDWSFFVDQFHEGIVGPTTGLRSLDKDLGGGLANLTLVGANEGDGKTSLALHMVTSALRADQDLDCLVYTLDQSKATTLTKLCCLSTGLDKETLRLQTQDQSATVKRRIEEGLAELQDVILPRMKLVEKSNLSEGQVVDVQTFCRDYDVLNRQTKATKGILVLDMFQSLDRFPETVAGDNDKDEYRLELIQQFMRKTQSESCPEGFPVIATSEIRKTERVELTTNDLRGSARLGSVPSNILLLWPPANTEQLGDVVQRHLMVAKSRHGHEGLLHVLFHHQICKFTEGPAVVVKDRHPSSRRGGDRNASQELDPRNDF